MTKVDIISGFLGAGKTTLIRRLLSEALKDEQVVLIENEFGEIGIDGGFLKDSGIVVNEMNAGCICCSLVGDFSESLKQVVETYHPDRILIEPSGVGKLSDVISAVQNTELDISLNSFVTVVDCLKAKMYLKNFGEFFENQVTHAGAILLSRTSESTETQIQATLALLRGLNANARIVTTPWKDLSGAQLLEVMEGSHDLIADLLHEIEHKHHHAHGEDCACGHDHEHHHAHGEDCTCSCHNHDHHHADEVFTSWGKETTKQYSEADIQSILTALSDTTLGTVLRAKGIVASSDGSEWLHFDHVPGEIQIRRGSADYTGRLCVIGSELDEERIAQIFGITA